jgi:putative addiction module component (TIGR02574 family)
MTRNSIAKRAREMSERDEEIDAAWDEEIERRVRQIDSGEVKTISWEEVREKAYSRLNALRKASPACCSFIRP